jgi:hypothetical protein
LPIACIQQQTAYVGYEHEPKSPSMANRRADFDF